MTETYTLEQLHEDLWHLNHKLVIMKELEYVIDNYWNLKDQLDGTWEESVALSRGEKGSIVGMGDLDKLDDIPELCTEIVSIDPSPFAEVADELSQIDRRFVDLEDDPGQILTKVIGSWYGSAADAFEDHLSKYSPAQSRQRELSTILVNANISANEIITSSHRSIRNLIAAASDAADVINKSYEMEKKRRDQAAATALVIIVGTVFTAGTASGVAAATAGAVNLSHSVHTANTASKEFEAIDLKDFVKEIKLHLATIMNALQSADEEIFGEIDAIQSLWTMRDCTIPAPPKSDEFDEGSFHHETSY